MKKFQKKNIRELKEFVYNSYIHDAEVSSVRYKWHEDQLKIETVNPIFHVSTDFTFCGIELMFAVKCEEYSGHDTIISLSVEEDFSYLQNHIPKYAGDAAEALYLLFQTLSGDELHIVAKEVVIETTT